MVAHAIGEYLERFVFDSIFLWRIGFRHGFKPSVLVGWLAHLCLLPATVMVAIWMLKSAERADSSFFSEHDAKCPTLAMPMSCTNRTSVVDDEIWSIDYCASVTCSYAPSFGILGFGFASLLVYALFAYRPLRQMDLKVSHRSYWWVTVPIRGFKEKRSWLISPIMKRQRYYGGDSYTVEQHEEAALKYREWFLRSFTQPNTPRPTLAHQFTCPFTGERAQTMCRGCNSFVHATCLHRKPEGCFGINLKKCALSTAKKALQVFRISKHGAISSCCPTCWRSNAAVSVCKKADHPVRIFANGCVLLIVSLIVMAIKHDTDFMDLLLLIMVSVIGVYLSLWSIFCTVMARMGIVILKDMQTETDMLDHFRRQHGRHDKDIDPTSQAVSLCGRKFPQHMHQLLRQKDSILPTSSSSPPPAPLSLSADIGQGAESASQDGVSPDVEPSVAVGVSDSGDRDGDEVAATSATASQRGKRKEGQLSESLLVDSSGCASDL